MIDEAIPENTIVEAEAVETNTIVPPVKKEKPVKETRECSVCCEVFNKSKNRPVSCPCLYSQCTKCVQQYLLGTAETAHCMNCKKPWDMEFLTQNMTKTFVNKTYKTHRENMLFEMERAMFSETMPYVEREVIKTGLREQINDLVQENRITLADLDAVLRLPLNEAGLREEINLRIKLETNNFEMEFLRRKILLLDNRFAARNQERHQFIWACSATDCKGFLSSQWKCVVCSVWTCPTCHDTIGANKGDAHTCLESSVKTAELLAKDSRPCPQCASIIFRSSGCPVMFCTQCHTGFNWNTGSKIKAQNIHNPHYAEYLRTRNKQQQQQETEEPQPTEMRCNEMIDMSVLTNRERRIWGQKLHIGGNITNDFKENKTKSISTLANNCNHIIDIVIPRLTPNAMVEQTNRQLRVLYLMNKITQEDFKALLQKQEKKNNKKNENLLVFQMYSQVCIDIANRYLQIKTKKEHIQLVNEHDELKKYVRECLKQIGQRYNCKPHPFFENGEEDADKPEPNPIIPPIFGW